MNIPLDSAVLDTAKLDAVMESIDEIFIDAAPDNLQYLFIIARDLVKRIRKDLETLEHEKRVADSIRTAHILQNQKQK